MDACQSSNTGLSLVWTKLCHDSRNVLILFGQVILFRFIYLWISPLSYSNKCVLTLWSIWDWFESSLSWAFSWFKNLFQWICVIFVLSIPAFMWHGLDCGVRLENLWSIGFEAFEIASLRDREGLYDDLIDANLLSAVVVAQHQRSAVRILSSANFYIKHLFTVNSIEKTKVKLALFKTNM